MAPMAVISLFLVKTYIAFARRHFVAAHLTLPPAPRSHLPHPLIRPPLIRPTLPSIGVHVSSIGYAGKNHLKWRENQLATQCTVAKYNELL